MTPDELTALLEKATPGRWNADERHDLVGIFAAYGEDVGRAVPDPTDPDRILSTRHLDEEQPWNDARAIVALHNLAPLLLDLWRAAEPLGDECGVWQGGGDDWWRTLEAVRAALRALTDHTEEDEA